MYIQRKTQNIFIETTKSSHGHGGPGWEFGTCLWSPSRNRGGGDSYSLMREPLPDDLVLHFYYNRWEDGNADTRLCGFSFVEQGFKEVAEQPPIPGDWYDQSPYYRIDLKDYTEFGSPLKISTFIHDYDGELWKEIDEDSPKYYPFTKYNLTIHTAQGRYLSKCTEPLYKLLSQALKIEESNSQLAVAEHKASYNVDPQNEYAESKRLSSEKYFFSRNTRLVKDAKEKYGPICQACTFDFSKTCKELGEGYCEAHHKNPLSERPESTWTDELRSKVDDINILCANCHRMIHRRRPALSVEELKEILKRK